MEKSIRDLVIEFFEKHPKQEMEHGPVVDWVERQYVKLYNKKPRDTWRTIRKLSQEGFLIKIAKGIYKYDPDYVMNKEFEDFSEEQKSEILKRDNYKCVMCGRGKKEGVELHIDHIKPKDLGGKATIENGQVLCSQHNFIKKNLKQTETGKKMFIKMYELAKKEDNEQLLIFCKDILETFEKHNMNGHIEWKK